MIVEYTRHKIDEGRHGSFEADYQSAVASLLASSHCLAYELSHCTEDQNHYALRIEWGFRTRPSEGVPLQRGIQDILLCGATVCKGH